MAGSMRQTTSGAWQLRVYLGRDERGRVVHKTKTAAVMAGRRRPGLFMTFSAPKGVSLIGLLGDDTTAGQVRAAHRQAVRRSRPHRAGGAVRPARP